MTVLSIALPAPATKKATCKRISAFTELPILPISPRFFHRYEVDNFQDSELLFGTADEEDLDATLSDDEEDEHLLNLDPKRWKEQDHYAVLGLSHLRYKATDEDIKIAHRKKVLKHHPDKKAAKTNNTNDDAFFKCIQKAYETLSDPVKRQQYDSVDDEIDDEIPEIAVIEDEEEFFEEFGPVFEREKRFSKNGPVPSLGTPDSTREEVEAFYDFWYNFDSWRTFEYLDKEDVDGADSRDDKRYLDKKNKAERARRKKEDNARLRKIVDLALKLDPRIQKFKKAEKAAKEAKKFEKERAMREQQEAARKKAEEERIAALKAEQAAKELAAENKKNKEERKKAIRKERKTIKNMITKDFNYFHPAGATVPIDELERVLNCIEFLFEKLESPEMLEEVRTRFEDAAKEGMEKLKTVFEYEYSELKNGSSKIEEAARQRAEEAARKRAEEAAALEEAKKKAERPWTVKEIKILIKAANMFPGGTVNRWQKIADYVALHSGEETRPEDQIIKKSGEVKKGTAFDNAVLDSLQNEPKKNSDTVVNDAPTVRDPASDASTQEDESKENSKASKVWTPAQQIQLQRALQKYPPSYKGADRWDKIASLVEGKTKKECMLRVKQLAEQAKSKRR
ncbi:hypothetical protein BKA69DRAFT_1125928 [Paraphysoderma sedebokerense]|nr:hypothetical protein BKA69DRAFT_1125928 [Paraphysoderma sedebokerense]